jgi:addiction module HigA family antidote
MNPCHPGEVLREAVSANDWTVTEFAKQLGVARNTASRLLNGRSRVTPAIALALERIGWSEADYWLRMQLNYDLAAARRKSEAAPARS